jgi:hypothetical protein
MGRRPGSSERSGRDEPTWVAIYKYIEAKLGISLYRYLYLKLAKALCLSYYILCFLLNKIGEEGRTGSARKQGWGEDEWGGGLNNVYKCK